LERRGELVHRTELCDRVAVALREWKPELLLALECGSHPFLQDLPGDFPKLRKVAWLFDDPFYFESSAISNLRAFDALYTVDQSWVAPLKLAIGRPVAAMPLGADPDTYRPLALRGIRRQPIAFVGTSYRGHPAGLVRQELLRHLAGFDLAIWGDGHWRGLVADGVDLGRCYRGGPIQPEKTNEVYNSADMVVNIHHPQIRHGTSLRTFAVCAAGAFQLVDWRPGLEESLEPGREVAAYRSGDDLAEQAARYLADEPARTRIAAAGLARVRAEHTYVHRLRRIIEDLDLRI
ncbi:MAG TPA: glycosyltransferase, partial [Gemmatimonadales bacterium]|nr:glycosyltransferase [Gemmatimonadales bacterium]